MTVKYKKSEVDIRQAVDSTSKSVGFSDIANSSVTRDHMGAMDHDLIPMWTHWQYTGGGEPEDYAGVSNGGRTISAANGNNGQSVNGRLGGTARGNFEVSFSLGYSWGWSVLTLISASNYRDGYFGDWSFSPIGDKRLWIANNSSNDQTLIQYWDGVKNTVPLSVQPGVSNGDSFKVWRKNGAIKVFIPGQSVITVCSWSDDLVVMSGNQSPHSTTINSAGKLSF